MSKPYVVQRAMERAGVQGLDWAESSHYPGSVRYELEVNGGSVWIEAYTRGLQEDGVRWGGSPFPEGKTHRDFTFSTFASRLANLHRLADLPEDLRAVADEFLTLHSAWGTAWGADATDDGGLFVCWNPGGLEYARFNADGAHFPSLSFASPGGEYFSLQMKTLRRSADFAEFVQRFKEGE